MSEDVTKLEMPKTDSPKEPEEKKPKRKSSKILKIIIGIIVLLVIIGAAAPSDPKDDMETNMEVDFDISNEKMAMSAAKAMLAIGITPDKYDELVADQDKASNGVYSFTYDSDTVYILFDGNTCSEIRTAYGDLVYSKEKKIKRNIRRYVPTGNQMSTLQADAETTIKAMLKAPDTAEFDSSAWEIHKQGNKYKVSGMVSSQNSFGAMLSMQFVCKYRWNGKDSESPELVDIQTSED